MPTPPSISHFGGKSGWDGIPLQESRGAPVVLGGSSLERTTPPAPGWGSIRLTTPHLKQIIIILVEIIFINVFISPPEK